MPFRTQPGGTCTRCGGSAAAEHFEVRADGLLCDACCAREKQESLDATLKGRDLEQGSLQRAALSLHAPSEGPRELPPLAAPPKMAGGPAKASPRRWPASIAVAAAVLPMLCWGACATGATTEDRAIGAWILTAPLSVIVGLVFLIAGQHRRLAAAALLSPFVSFGLALVHPGFHYSRGRALRRKGVPRVPPEAPSEDWLAGQVRDLVLEAPAEAAAGWRANAATEAASVAAFSHLATELLALGAPAHLVEKAHEDALDEIRHARLCFGIARAIDGRDVGPGPFPYARAAGDGALTFASLAADCLVESCVLESASARAAAALASREDVAPPLREVLAAIAVDEARHAEHGREIVAYCLARGGADVVHAMRRRLQVWSEAASAGAVATDALERHGLAGPSLWNACVRAAHRDVEVWLLVPRVRRAR